MVKFLSTWVDHRVNSSTLLMSHETKNWEDDKSSDKTGAAVEQAEPETVPGGQTETVNRGTGEECLFKAPHHDLTNKHPAELN